MRTHIKCARGFLCALSAALLVAVCGCAKSSKEKDAPVPSTPKEAATQLQQAFTAAGPEVTAEVKQNAAVASQAMRSGEYEAAVQSLGAIKQSQNLTLDQGLAVHNSMVALEARLIAAIEAGDPNAKRAYNLLKRMKKD
jgi:ABC-type glycerol-3-phosphate transport system substrate-binding protein